MSAVMPRELAAETAKVLSPAFGDQAVRAYTSGRMLDATGPSVWSLFAVLMSIAVLGFAMAFAGTVEVVATGEGRLEAPRAIVTFLPESDGVFVEAGQQVRVELERGELGVLHAEVVDATPSADGSSTPTYRVALALVDDEQLRRMQPLLRPGTRVTTRHVLRTRRAIAMLLDPLDRWLD